MRKLIPILAAIALIISLPVTASAQDGPKKPGKKREALLKKFDKDGDGKLNEQERAALKEFLKSKRKDKDGGKQRGGLKKKVMKRFDSDRDRKLNETERAELKKFLESHRGKGGRRR